MRRGPLRINVEHVLSRAQVPEPTNNETGEGRPLSPRAKEIAAAAIAFFNEWGAARMSINQLAAAMGISAGNLHYHFRTNSDLYRAVFQALNADVRDILLRPRMPMTLDAIVQHQIDIQACLWRHRYFFRDLDYLVNSDRTIFIEFLHLQNWAVDEVVRLREFYEANFNLAPIEGPISAIEVAQNTWMMWISWIRWETIANAAAPDAGELNAIFHRLAWHHFSLHGAYMSKKVARAIASKLRRKLAIRN